MKLLIAIPSNEQMHAGFVQSLVKLVRQLEKDGINFTVSINSGSLVYDAREKLAAKARFENFTHVLWLDSDMVFGEDVFSRLLSHDKDFVTGVCHARRYPYVSCCFKRLQPEAVRYRRDCYPDDLFQIEASGFACVLTTTNLLRAIKHTHGTLFMPTTAYGEDLAFCSRARECGFELWADPAVRPKHIGYIEIDANNEVID